jgi:metal-dependent amidase/aminoacylase/carboxypeptidase family protein
MFLLALDIQDKKVSPETRIQRNVVGDVESPNVYRLESSAKVWIRSGDDEYLSSIVYRVKDIARGCAMAVGAEAEVVESGIYYRRIVQSPVLEGLVKENIEYIGRKFTPDQPSPYPFGTDFGNISQAIPCAQLLFGIPGGFNFHTEHAVEQSRSKAALESMVEGAKVMACTAIDILSESSLIRKAKQELEDSRAKKFKDSPTWHAMEWD